MQHSAARASLRLFAWHPADPRSRPQASAGSHSTPISRLSTFSELTCIGLLLLVNARSVSPHSKQHDHDEHTSHVYQQLSSIELFSSIRAAISKFALRSPLHHLAHTTQQLAKLM